MKGGVGAVTSTSAKLVWVRRKGEGGEGGGGSAARRVGGEACAAPKDDPPPRSVPHTLRRLLRAAAALRRTSFSAPSTRPTRPQLWDLVTDRVLSLDFGAELESVHRRSSRLCTAAYDDARGVILVGSDDGSVFVRRVARIAETNDLAVALVRFCAPSAEASAPSRVSRAAAGAGGGLRYLAVGVVWWWGRTGRRASSRARSRCVV